jgi:N-methylhydantoinase A
VAYEIVRGRLMRLGSFDPASANRLLREMRSEAEAIVRRAEPAARLLEQRSAFMRYRGQGHEIAVELPVRNFTPADRSALRELFETAYRRLYSRAIPGVEIEILSWVVAVSAPAEGALGAAVPERRLPGGGDLPARRSFAWGAHQRPGRHRRGPDLNRGEPTLRRPDRPVRLY